MISIQPAPHVPTDAHIDAGMMARALTVLHQNKQNILTASIPTDPLRAERQGRGQGPAFTRLDEAGSTWAEEETRGGSKVEG